MPLPLTLTWQTINPPLCPCCLEELTNDNLMFDHNTAFCPLCVLPRMDRPRFDCLCLLRDAVAQDHRATYRGLHFFTPSRHPKQPLQLVRTNSPDDWLLDPDSDLCGLATDLVGGFAPRQTVDDNPVAGGSPV